MILSLDTFVKYLYHLHCSLNCLKEMFLHKNTIIVTVRGQDKTDLLKLVLVCSSLRQTLIMHILRKLVVFLCVFPAHYVQTNPLFKRNADTTSLASQECSGYLIAPSDGHHLHGHHNSHTPINDLCLHGDLSVDHPHRNNRGTCPFVWESHHNPSRIPKTLPYARCICSDGCIDLTNPANITLAGSCEPILMNIRVLIHRPDSHCAADDDEGREYYEQEILENWPVGCHCERST